MSTFSEKIQIAAQSVRARYAANVDIAIVLGSGLGHIAPDLQNPTEFDYEDIPNLNATSVTSHHGRLLIGEFNQKVVAVCQGRHHLYEGYSAQQVAMMTYLLSELGTKQLIITNAAGALNPKFAPGDIMLIRDHINFTGQNPIVGQWDELGNRFVDMSQAYDGDLLNLAQQAANGKKIHCHSGIYAGVLGPSLETSAERRMLKVLGSDAVGMSTVMEVIAANQCGIQVLGLSAITNMALGDDQQQPDTIEDVLRHAKLAGKGIKEIINSILLSHS